MIPKVIHYCWFGHKPILAEAKKCINSWKRFFPDYEIKEWNESNFDIHIAPFVYEAYKLKKWAFVSDYARLWIMYHYGGLYFDTDVEVIKDMSPIIKNGPFMGCELEYDVPGMLINLGLGCGAYPKMNVYRDLLDFYNKSHIIKKSGIVRLVTIVKIATDYFKSKGVLQCLDIVKAEGVTIYPTEYFCPMNYGTRKMTITEKTYTIHHYSATWLKFHWLETIEEPFWDFLGHKNHQILWRIRNMMIRYSYKFGYCCLCS